MILYRKHEDLFVWKREKPSWRSNLLFDSFRSKMWCIESQTDIQKFNAETSNSNSILLAFCTYTILYSGLWLDFWYIAFFFQKGHLKTYEFCLLLALLDFISKTSIGTNKESLFRGERKYAECNKAESTIFMSIRTQLVNELFKKRKKITIHIFAHKIVENLVKLENAIKTLQYTNQWCEACWLTSSIYWAAPGITCKVTYADRAVVFNISRICGATNRTEIVFVYQTN